MSRGANGSGKTASHKQYQASSLTKSLETFDHV
jgi:hypothetical protein